MPLHDLLTPKLVELGAIKIGTLGEERTSKRGGTYRMPQKLDHFIITTKFRDASGRLTIDQEVMSSLATEYADDDGNVREIPIAVLSDNIEDFLRAAWVRYEGKKCYARSDGVTLRLFYDKEGNKLETPEEHPWEARYETMERNGTRLFKKHVTMDMVIALPEARWGGVYRFRTTSTITGDQLYGSLIHLKQITGGVLRGMPLVLCVRPLQVAPDGKTTTVYVVHVELRGPDLIALQSRALEIARFGKEHRKELASVRREMRLLMHEPGLDEDDATQADVQMEFQPEPTNRVLDAFVSKVAEAGDAEALDGLVALIDTIDPPLQDEERAECMRHIDSRREQLAGVETQQPNGDE